ncbi:MAG TPA: SDR family NAD-dependent epimerase/dehydratase, partial [Microvirga sp.]|nr:SDR family NAD-dependent epimerase/dehydratase [Microvirga sp.]
YVTCLDLPDEKIDGKVFNAGYENHSVRQLAETVQSAVGPHVELVVEQTNDLRSYHVSSEKIRREIGFEPKRTIEQAVHEMVAAFRAGKLPRSMEDSRYFNIKRMQEINLT